MKISIKRIAMGLIVGLPVLSSLAVSGWLYLRGEIKPLPEYAPQTFASEPIKHPKAWTDVPISKENKVAGVINQSFREDPDASLLIRAQDTPNAANEDLNNAASEVVSALGKEVAGFNLIKKEVKKLAGVSVIGIDYSAQGDKTITRTYMLIVPQNTKTYYLLFKSGYKDMAGIRKDIKTIATDYILSLKK